MKNAIFWDLRRVAIVRTDISEERIAFIIRVTRSRELGTTLAVTSNRSTLPRNTMVYTPSPPDDGGDMFLRNVASIKTRGAISQKTAFFIVTAMKTSNLT
jgi:hypothetical protein